MSVGFCNNQLSSLENIGQICIKSGKSGLPTPNKVAKSMVNLIPDDWFDVEPYMNGNIFNKDAYIESHRVIDICCNSGVLLEHFYYKFMQELNRAISNSDEREDYILQNLLYAFCLDSKLVRLLRMRLYWSSKCKGHIYQYNIVSDTGRDLIRARSVLESMKFDVVVGNPPYNNDMYLDFVMKGHELSKTYDLWITPAKWQAKGDDNNKKFRDYIVPYMTSILFYPFAQDIFDIRNVDGIAIYLVDKDEHSKKSISNISKISLFNSTSVRYLDVLNNTLSNLLSKLGNIKYININSIDVRYFGLGSGDIGGNTGAYKILRGSEVVGYCNSSYISKNKQDLSKFKVCLLHMNGNAFMTKEGNTLAMNKLYLLNTDELPVYDYIPIFVSNNKDECISYISYFNTKFIRFILFSSAVGQTCNNYEYWRFVPDPGSFDRIFEDKPLDGYTPDENGEYIDADGNKHCSLYVKYKLTQQEINIIESVIRERK